MDEAYKTQKYRQFEEEGEDTVRLKIMSGRYRGNDKPLAER
jgi:hypothetical protein